MARCPDARIYAFEPNPKIFSQLAAAADYKGFAAINKGCGAIEERCKLYDRADSEHGGHASLYADVISKLHNQCAVEIAVEITTVDTFVRQSGIDRIDLLKIDVEGAELDVLRGAHQCIRQSRIDAVLFEFNEMNIVSRVFLQDFFELLPDFDFHRVGSRSLVPIQRGATPLLRELFAYQNIVALRRPLPAP
jgi:FkbM family methyltransferase